MWRRAQHAIFSRPVRVTNWTSQETHIPQDGCEILPTSMSERDLDKALPAWVITPVGASRIVRHWGQDAVSLQAICRWGMCPFPES